MCAPQDAAVIAALGDSSMMTMGADSRDIMDYEGQWRRKILAANKHGSSHHSTGGCKQIWDDWRIVQTALASLVFILMYGQNMHAVCIV